MKRKAFIYSLVIIALAGLSFYIYMLHSSYKSVLLEEAERRNVAMEEVEILLAGPPPDWTEEVLMGLFANRNELAVRVRTGGCTH